MLRLEHSKPVKTISIIVLAFFLWSFGGVFDIAYAITDSSKFQVASFKLKEQKPSEKFEEALEKIREAEERTHKKIQKGEDTEKEETEVRIQKTEIEKHDIEIKKQFKETEEKIKSLPEEIKKRHTDFVKKYEDNLNELKTNLDDIEKAKTKEGKRLAHKKTKEFLEKTKPPKKHKPLDPNKLPHRTAEPIFKEPRTKPEEFKTEDRAQNTEHRQKPILVASNGPLTGLIDSDSKYSAKAVIPEKAGLLSDSPEARIQNDYPIEALGYDKLNNGNIGTANYGTMALGDSGTMLLAAAEQPTDADLAETIEVKFTPEIREIAGLLNNDPVLLYEFVKNNFKYEPYYGSLKGAQQTLFEQAGNDFDQASLLIALYRSIGIPTRYVCGTIQVPIDKAMSWVGAPDSLTALKIFSTNGIPVAKNPGGVITDLQIEHVWIEVFLPYNNYRGKINAISNNGGTWIPLDPSFKQHFPNTSGINLFQASGLNVETILQNYLSEIKITLPVREYLSLIKSKIEQTMPDKRFYDLIWTNYIDNRELGLLPSTLEYDVIVIGYKTSEIKDALRHKISFNTIGSILEEDLSYATTLPDIAGKRITLSYTPATAIDEEIIRQYGNIYDTPLYLIQVKPVLKIDGQIKATGGSIGMAVSHELKQTLLMSNGKVEDIISTPIIAGAYYAIGIDLQRIPSKTLYRRADNYLKLLDTASSALDKDEILGEFLHLLVTGYLEQKDLSNKFIAHTMQFRDCKKTTLAVIGFDLSTSYIFSIPIKTDVGLLFLDIKRDVSNPIDMSGANRSIKDFMLMDGMNGSFLESSIFETVFGVDGISTLKALALANAAGIPVYKITPDNANTYLPLLQLSADVKTDIQNALNKGLNVTVSQKEIRLNQWSGVGYIIENPQTGEAAYMISGGLAGGSLTSVIANVQSMIKTGKMTQAEVFPYIENLLYRFKIVVSHPLKGNGEITSEWNPARVNPVDGKIRPHNGVDIGVPVETEVIAVADGVISCGDDGSGGYGKYIIIDHGLGVYTLYAHLSQFKVETGATVKETDLIALSGMTGSSKGAHLHFSVIMTNNFENWRKFEESIDPGWLVGID